MMFSHEPKIQSNLFQKKFLDSIGIKETCICSMVNLHKVIKSRKDPFSLTYIKKIKS